MNESVLPAELGYGIELECNEGYAVNGEKGKTLQTMTCIDLDLWDVDSIQPCLGEYHNYCFSTVSACCTYR